MQTDEYWAKAWVLGFMLCEVLASDLGSDPTVILLDGRVHITFPSVAEEEDVGDGLPRDIGKDSLAEKARGLIALSS
jgi:hypothetical protein